MALKFKERNKQISQRLIQANHVDQQKHFDDLKRTVSSKNYESAYQHEGIKTEAPLDGFMQYFTYQYEILHQKHKAEYHQRKA